MKLSGADILWACLVEQGVDTVFGYPGSAILPTEERLLDRPIRHVLVRHEQSATHMADGYARASGRIGVAVATSGPRATNLVTGIATAMMDSIPLVCITGLVPTPQPGSDAFQLALQTLAGDDAGDTLRQAAEARAANDPDRLSNDDVEHFEADWLHTWWQQHAPADTLRAGLREAIKHADAVQKPMEFLWICVADDTFQVYFSESPAQVTVMILTPPPTEHTDEYLTEPEPIWVVKLCDDYDDAYPILGGPDLISPPETVGEVGPGLARRRPNPRIIKQQVHHS